MLYNLPERMRRVFELTAENIELEQIDKLKDKNVAQVQQLFSKVKETLRMSFLNRYQLAQKARSLKMNSIINTQLRKMKNKVYMSDLHFVHTAWNSELSFEKDKLKISKIDQKKLDPVRPKKK